MPPKIASTEHHDIAGTDLAAANDEVLFQPMERTSRRFYITVFVLLSFTCLMGIAYTTQLSRGLGVTGLTIPVYWGIYITNFVFFIGISHAGTLISAILRICHAEWRRSITRAAEVITVMVRSEERRVGKECRL